MLVATNLTPKCPRSQKSGCERFSKIHFSRLFLLVFFCSPSPPSLHLDIIKSNRSKLYIKSLKIWTLRCLEPLFFDLLQNQLFQESNNVTDKILLVWCSPPNYATHIFSQSYFRDQVLLIHLGILIIF